MKRNAKKELKVVYANLPSGKEDLVKTVPGFTSIVCIDKQPDDSSRVVIGFRVLTVSRRETVKFIETLGR